MSEVKGLADLARVLDQFPDKIAANLMRGALRAGAKPILESARAKIHNVDGDLAESLRIGTKKVGTQVIARIIAGVSKKYKRPYYAHMVETGTKPHVIKAKNGKMLAIGVRKVKHPGAKKHPFMRPAADENTGPALQAVADYLRKRLATKYGIDVPEPLQDGDE